MGRVRPVISPRVVMSCVRWTPVHSPVNGCGRPGVPAARCLATMWSSLRMTVDHTGQPRLGCGRIGFSDSIPLRQLGIMMLNVSPTVHAVEGRNSNG